MPEPGKKRAGREREETIVELRHLDTLLAVAQQGSFTAAADALQTVQSNVSEQVRQLEAELGARLLERGRKGAVPTECGLAVLERARRVRRELTALRDDIAMLQGLQRGYSGFGIVGTASRWLVPALVTDLRARAPGVRLRVNEGASERLAGEVLGHEIAQAVVTEPVRDKRLRAEPLLEEDLVGLAPADASLPRRRVTMRVVAEHPLVLPPADNPLRIEIEQVAASAGVTLDVPVEVEGIRLVADLVAAGVGLSILPETALPPDLVGLRTFRIEQMPPRRLALVTARDSHLTLADRAVRDSVLRLVEQHAARRR